MKSKELELIVKQVKSDMDRVGIPYDNETPVVINHRLSRALGQCKYRNRKAYVIELSDTIIASPIQELKNTICHELLHSATVGDRHGGMWKKYADKMTKNSEYTITRLHDVENLNHDVMMSKYKYKATCTGCGSVNYYNRKSNFIKQLEIGDGYGGGWYCSKCKSHHWILETIK